MPSANEIQDCRILRVMYYFKAKNVPVVGLMTSTMTVSDAW